MSLEEFLKDAQNEDDAAERVARFLTQSDNPKLALVVACFGGVARRVILRLATEYQDDAWQKRNAINDVDIAVEGEDGCRQVAHELINQIKALPAGFGYEAGPVQEYHHPRRFKVCDERNTTSAMAIVSWTW